MSEEPFPPGVSSSTIRLGCFAGVLLLMALWEALAPRRRREAGRPLRWASNLGLIALASLAARLLVPLGAVGAALLARERGWGLFNRVLLSPWLALVLSVVVLDFAIYLQHVLFHKVPWLWRLHLVHHADLDVDATTGVRFHVFEILLSLGFKMAVVMLLGAPALGVLLFEVLLNATSLFNHANVRLPAWLDRPLRLVVVTPEMHRVHHSVVASEANRNFGFNLPWWDYLSGTFQDRPAAGHEGMTLGLPWLRDERLAARLHWMLLLPFLGPNGNRAPRWQGVVAAKGNPLDEPGRPPKKGSGSNVAVKRLPEA
jgi:sterol desaturase/sphingolipid hydroxylase (fatty acid hydroxylase superfamily)